MSADQVPSDAEVEALIAERREKAAESAFMAATLDAHGHHAQAEAFHASDEQATAVANALEALQRERKTLPARVAAADKAYAELVEASRAMMRAMQFSASLFSTEQGAADFEAVCRVYPDARAAWNRLDFALCNTPRGLPSETDHLAAQLAAAEARGMRRAAEATLDEPCTSPQWTEARAAEEALKGRTYRRILAMIPTPPAGGADDAE